jgi:hypothetical protein
VGEVGLGEVGLGEVCSSEDCFTEVGMSQSAFVRLALGPIK